MIGGKDSFMKKIRKIPKRRLKADIKQAMEARRLHGKDWFDRKKWRDL